MSESKTIFRLKNNDARSHSFAGKTCIAGAGCPTPADAQKMLIDGVPFRLPDAFPLTEEEMFKSFRGVLATMKTVNQHGRPSIEVFVDGVPTPLTSAQILEWAADYRTRKNLPEPRNHEEHVAELEKAMNRQEDPIEKFERARRAEGHRELVETVTAAVLAALAAQKPVAAPAERVVGRNDEKPEGEIPQGRSRPRT